MRQGQRQLAIREGESLGDVPENARKRDWLPGRCGLTPVLLSALWSWKSVDKADGRRSGYPFVIARSRMGKRASAKAALLR